MPLKVDLLSLQAEGAVQVNYGVPTSQAYPTVHKRAIAVEPGLSMMHSSSLNSEPFGIRWRCKESMPFNVASFTISQTSKEIFKQYILVLHSSTHCWIQSQWSSCTCAISSHNGFHFNSYRDPFIIRFPRRDDWLIDSANNSSND